MSFTEKTQLIDRLYQFLQQTKGEELQVKPTQFNPMEEKYTLFDNQQDLQLYKKKYNSKINKQLSIICQNIIDSLFNLNQKKYNAIMNRLFIWGFQITMQQFIINYYLIIKKDHKLRQFIYFNMDKIIKILKDILQKQLLSNMKEFKFVDDLSKIKIQELQNKIKQNQEKLQQIESDDEEISEQEQNNIQQQILQKLKKKHPKLQQEI